MRQRLGLARSLLHEPPVLFLDEPTSGLDPEAAAEVRSLIAELRGQGRAILLCTHNLEEAEALSDRLGIFRGRLFAEGTADQLREQAFRPEVLVRFRDPETTPSQLACARRVEGVLGGRVEDYGLVLSVEAPHDVLPSLARALVAGGAELVYLGEHRRSLEEVYLHMLDHNAR